MTECNKYRRISLLDVVYKSVTTLIKLRLEATMEMQIGEYEARFRRERRTAEQIFII